MASETKDRTVNDNPGCAYGMVTRERVTENERRINDVCGKINTLIWTIIGATVVQIMLRLWK